MPHDLDALFRAYHGELNRFARRRVRDREAAADIVQDAFLRYAAMAQDAERAALIDNPRFFLWRVVANLAADFGRRLRRRAEEILADPELERIADPHPLADRVLETRQQLRLLRLALAELPADCRKALLLNRVGGLSHAEVGARLGVSASMVSKHIMRALRHCAKRLGLP
jgi:RNA polymerase sigma-70 factor (ECF subfamily)